MNQAALHDFAKKLVELRPGTPLYDEVMKVLDEIETPEDIVAFAKLLAQVRCEQAKS